jgi:eukaryotic-like serine/threonine-protein kinase
MSAITPFHGEVSEDLLMREKQFEGLRTKLPRGAADFYGKWERLLKGQTDPMSCGALGKAYDELGELTAMIGNKSKALAVHLKALAAYDHDSRSMTRSRTIDVETAPGVL